VSSLQCAATLVVARHGDAAFAETTFSDEGGSLTLEGRRQATQLADSLRDRRVAHIWSSDAARGVQTAEIVAARLGVGVTTSTALREVHVGDLLGQPFSRAALEAVTRRWYDGSLDVGFPGGETGHDVVARFRDELASIADQHRGETVLVVAHQEVASLALPLLADNLTGALTADRRLDNGEAVELVVDADGWQLARWGSDSLV
jgi:broad specificity phosphatase PhoE